MMRRSPRPLGCTATPWLVIALLLSGCSGSAPAGDGVDIIEGAGDGAPPPCARGQIEAPEGGCMPVGIQGCADRWVGQDGLCHPSMALCPAGQLPKLDAGCVSAGIPACAAAFVGDDGLCRPTLERCPAGTFPVPELGCAPLDGAEGCGEEAWANIPDAPGNVYVDPRYPGTDGDGSKARPFPTIAAAMAHVEEGGRLALSAGVYAEPVSITRTMELAGRCPSLVRITLPAAHSAPAVVTVNGAQGVAIRGVRLGGPARGVLAQDAGGLVIDRAHIAGALGVGVLAMGTGTQVSISRAWIEGTAPAPGGELPGLGAAAVRGATLVLDGSAVTTCHVAGLAALGAGATARARGSAIEAIRSAPGLDFGVGGFASEGGQVSIERSAIVGVRYAGVLAQGSGSSAVVADSLVTGTHAAADGIGAGLVAHTGARVEVLSSVLLENKNIGVLALREGTEATLRGNLIQGHGHHDLFSEISGGVLIGDSARALLEDNAVVRNEIVGVALSLGDASLRHNLIEDTLSPPDADNTGHGVIIVDGRADVTSNAIVGNHVVGLHAHGPEVELTMTENIVEGTREDRAGLHGRGCAFSSGARVTFAGNVVTDNRDLGVFIAALGVFDGLGIRPTVEVTGSLIQSTNSQALSGEFGAGLAAEEADLKISSSVIRWNRTGGLLLFQVTADVQRTRISDIEGGSFSLSGGERLDNVGDGVMALDGSAVDLSDVTVTGCARAGLLYLRSTGALSQLRANKNRFGLVFGGEPNPALGDDCIVTNNAEQDKIEDGELPVPAAPSPLP